MSDWDVRAYDKKLDEESKVSDAKQSVYEATLSKCKQAMIEIKETFEEECRAAELSEYDSEELWKELLNDGFDGLDSM